MIIPLHNHSMYSALDGFSRPEEIADRCLEIGASAAGVTDHGVVSGHLHFDKALREKGIKPIFGVELYHGLKTTHAPKERDQAHLIALAKNDEGLRNLWRLVNATARRDHFHYVGRVFWEDLEKYHEGLVVTSACALGLVPRSVVNDDYSYLNRYLSIFGDDFYLEIHTYPKDKMFRDVGADTATNMEEINKALISVANERGINVVYANDAHYAFPWQYQYHDLYLAIQVREDVSLSPNDRKMYHPPNALCILDESDVRKALSYLPNSAVDMALSNSVDIAEKCTAGFPSVRRHLPKFVPHDCPWIDDENKSKSPEVLFIDLVTDGIYAKYGENPARAVWERVLHEIEVFIRDGIHHYFLMGWDEMQFAIHNGIPRGCGRGSSAGSIVAYALDITDADPLYYNLSFERFWNSGRIVGFPDIDSDFSRARRQEVIEYLKQRWGESRVCAIGTTTYLKPKATVDKLAQGCGITLAEANELKRIIDLVDKIDIVGHEQVGWNPDYEPNKLYYVKNTVGDKIEEWVNEDPQRADKRRMFVDFCEVCCSRVKQYGVHASGIVISDVDLADELPAYLRGDVDKNAVPATMFPMSDVDARQFVKLDVLGLRTLDVLTIWEQMVGEQGMVVKWSGLDKEEHPAEMWELLERGLTAGIFQVEDGYGKTLCQKIKPSSVYELAVINALNRPGPIQAGIPDEYIARRIGAKEIVYPNEILKHLVEGLWSSTYGVPIFQEQIIGLFTQMGYTPSESDDIRKILGKKHREMLQEVYDGHGEWEGRGFHDRMKDFGMEERDIKSVWMSLAGFADYSFNLSHTIAYAILGFRTLYAKYHAPAQFYAACLCSFESSEPKRKEMMPEYIRECRQLGIELHGPDIQHSRERAYAIGKNLYFGFNDIKGIGHSGSYLVSIRDKLDISSYESFLASLDEYNAQFLKQDDRKGQSPKQKFNAAKCEALHKVGAWGDINIYDLQENEAELLGVVVSPLDVNIPGTDSFDDALVPFDDKADSSEEKFTYTVGGVITSISRRVAKKTNVPYAIVKILNGNQQLSFTVFSKDYRTFVSRFRPHSVGKFTIVHSKSLQFGENYYYIVGKRYDRRECV